MASNINPLFPLTTNATTQSVRDNFAFAKSEIEALQLGNASFIQTGTGAVFRTTQDKLRETISLADYGVSTANTGAQNTAALTVLLGNMTPGTGAGNRLLFCPGGQYDFTEVDFPNSLSNIIVRGEGEYTTRFNWVGANGVPFFKMVNARYNRFESLALINTTGNIPSYGIQVHRAAGQVGLGAATGCSFSDLYIGGPSAGALTTGIGYTCDGGQDSNNDFGTFERLSFDHMASYGLAFKHSNSLVHQIRGCSFGTCAVAAISNVGDANSAILHMGGSFSAVGCVSGICTALFEIYGALHGSNVTGWVSENDVNLLAMPFTYNSTTGFLKLAFLGCEFSLTGTGNIVVFDAGTQSLCVLDILGCGLTAPAGSTLSFPSTGSKVNIFGGSSSLAAISYNNEVTIKNWYQFAGAPTYTNLGSGTLRFERGDGFNRLNVMPVFTSGVTPSVDALPGGTKNIVYLIYAAPTNITGLANGLMGDEITFYASNGNATLVHGASAGNFRLRGATNVTLVSGNVITLKRLDTVTGLGYWVEIARNF